jgi:hypothetical protein
MTTKERAEGLENLARAIDTACAFGIQVHPGDPEPTVSEQQAERVFGAIHSAGQDVYECLNDLRRRRLSKCERVFCSSSLMDGSFRQHTSEMMLFAAMLRQEAISMGKIECVKRGVTIIEDGVGLRYKNRGYYFTGAARWKVVHRLLDATDPDGWVSLPNKSRSLGTFDKGDARAFKRDAIEPKSHGSGNKEGCYRIRP